MKKQNNSAISEHFRELAKKSWKVRKAKILGKKIDKDLKGVVKEKLST